MKKAIVVLGVMVIGASAVLAQSVTVPFFRDNPNDSVTGFIGLKNNTTRDITLSIVYTQDEDGTPVPQTPAVTHLLPANASISWRPVQRDSDPGGSNLEGDGAAVPNTSPRDGTGSTKFTGGVTITWTGSPGEVQGRYVETTPSGPFSYLAPGA